MKVRSYRCDGVSEQAAELLAASEVIDLHLDGFIWHRILGYDLHRRHGPGPLRGRFGGHLDFVRAHDHGLSAGMWSITTNVLRSARGRWRAFERNLERLEKLVTEPPAGAPPIALARDLAEYRRGREAACHVVLPAIQGANALEAAPDGPASIPDRRITRVTLVHLTNSCFGVTSSPLAGRRKREGLTARGRKLVEQLNAERIFVDLAHLNGRGFWDAVAVHDPSQPLLCTHTGVDGVYEHWRNLDDRQLRAIADTGGVIGVIFEPLFLGPRGRLGPLRDGRMVVEHLRHIVATVGEDHAALGSDYDGMITPPEGLRHEPAYGRLVQWMLELGWNESRIRKILGENFLRCLGALRPGAEGGRA